MLIKPALYVETKTSPSSPPTPIPHHTHTYAQANILILTALFGEFRRVKLFMNDAPRGRHPLHIPWSNHATVAHRISMLHLAREDNEDDEKKKRTTLSMTIKYDDRGDYCYGKTLQVLILHEQEKKQIQKGRAHVWKIHTTIKLPYYSP